MPENKNSSREHIEIKNSRVHNLKNVSVNIPRNALTVITGVSGSGKSSLAFDTLYAEGQRRYAESLSAYVRQFVNRMDKPDVDAIRGISPAIAIEQKVNTRNPRSTVGTSTEIYDYLKLLFARVGRTFSPVSGEEVKRHTIEDVVSYVGSLKKETRALLLSPLNPSKGRTIADELGVLLQKGFSRIWDGQAVREMDEIRNEALLAELNPSALPEGGKKRKVKSAQSSRGFEGNYWVLTDRFVVNDDDDFLARVADSVQTAFSEGHGTCKVVLTDSVKMTDERLFSNRFEQDGIVFEAPSVQFFSFNNPYGACKTCEGFGQVIGVDETLVIPNPNLSIYDGAIACWRGEKMSDWNQELLLNAIRFDFPVHKPYKDLTSEQKQLIWTGNKFFTGLNSFFVFLEKESYKVQYRVMLSRYRGRKVCPDCLGTRLRKDAAYVKVGGKSISEIVLMQVNEALQFFQSKNAEENQKALKLNPHDGKIADRILLEIRTRLTFLNEVGLGYLTLNRLSNSLSGGESQRINLATAIGSSLVGSMYILDEPSIGLHPRDTLRLIGILNSLKNLGNSVIVVEHDEEIMRAADHLIDLGPGAGSNGGNLLYEGPVSSILTHPESLTGKYLSGHLAATEKKTERPWSRAIRIVGAYENTLKNISVAFPLGVITVVTGVSGSGKSSLIKSILFPALKKKIAGFGENPGKHETLDGDVEWVKAVEFVDQNPIGKSSRSNPATYIKAYDEIRSYFSELPLSKQRGYKSSHFSFNVPGGRCDVCEGSGETVIEMQFMADIHLRCESCGGKQFREEVLEVREQEKNIYDVLQMTVDDAILFFGGLNQTTADRVVKRILPLKEVGLGYVKLGQSASTLSGGEAQRIKLASFFSRDAEEGHTVFLFDEPTTGLHFHDIRTLSFCFDKLVELGHTVIIIEHNPEVIRHADWVIDLGPGGGDEGGHLVFEGTPRNLAQFQGSYTGQFLKF